MRDGAAPPSRGVRAGAAGPPTLSGDERAGPQQGRRRRVRFHGTPRRKESRLVRAGGFARERALRLHCLQTHVFLLKAPR